MKLDKKDKEIRELGKSIKKIDFELKQIEQMNTSQSNIKEDSPLYFMQSYIKQAVDSGHFDSKYPQSVTKDEIKKDIWNKIKQDCKNYKQVLEKEKRDLQKKVEKKRRKKKRIS